MSTIDILALQDNIYDRIQQTRLQSDLPEIADVDELAGRDKYTSYSTYNLELNVPDDSMDAESLSNWVLKKVEDYLANPSQLDPAHAIYFSSTILGRTVTHMGIDITQVDTLINVVFKGYTHYFEIEPLGPIIDGDLVISGSSVNDQYSPALVVVSSVEMEDGMQQFHELATIPPTRMMVNASDDPEEPFVKYIIPVSIDVEHRNKSLEIRVFVDLKSNVSYEDDVADFAAHERRKDMIDACVIRTGDNESVINTGNNEDVNNHNHNTAAMMDMMADGELLLPSSPAMQLEGVDDDDDDAPRAQQRGDAAASPTGSIKSKSSNKQTTTELTAAEELEEMIEGNFVIRDIHIANDYDDVISLQQEGYQLMCTNITAHGSVSDQDHLWKFHILAGYGPNNEPGLEDLVWVKCLKSLGTLPQVPFYNILHDYDLSSPDDDYSVYIAVKIGTSPKFKRLLMMSSAYEDEEHLNKYVSGFTGFYRPAPKEVENAFGGHCGVMLVVNNAVESSHMSLANRDDLSVGSSHRKKTKQRANSFDGDDFSDDEDEDDEYDDTEEALRALEEQLANYQAEKQHLLTLNAEWQKKAVALMAREKALQGQTAAARASADMIAAINSSAPATADPNSNVETTGAQPPQANHASSLEQLEKEKQYQDTLQLIVEERNRLNKQLKEFDQLALDLQTRLDDKEFKAKSISTSFKQFKKEILSKAENSRTGHTLTKPQIQQIEQSESKHEEELEKVRLRHISLKTLQKKLERTLRAREQLAEGLHMIDFEQLKIENQTLNEKIEERNEELAKLKRKKTTTIQVLTHIREKLRFVEQANQHLQEKVAGVEVVISDLRNTVTAEKLERDDIRGENKEWKAKQGFATSDLLLVDFEKQKQTTEELKAAITELKNRYDILVKQVNSVPNFNSLSNGNSKQLLPPPAGGSWGSLSNKR